jgi:hypothetical protein
MKNKRTYYHLVLDRSGSMANCWDEACQVLGQQLDKIKGYSREFPDQQIYFSFCLFDSELIFSKGVEPIDQAKFDIQQVGPRGMTALYDAIGHSVQFLKRKLGSALEEEDTDVIMLILTDGYENCSREYSQHQVKSLIHSLKVEEKWSFVFLGAGIDIKEVTQDFALDGENMMSFEKKDIFSSLNMVNDEFHSFFDRKQKGQPKRKFFEE